jgi:hypothetical protein
MSPSEFDRRAYARARNVRAIARLRLEREELGVCRHCGGAVPCSSEFGDQSVGVRHSSASLRRVRRASS